MAKVKVVSLFLVALLLCSVLSFAARPEPASPSGSKNQQQGDGAKHAEVVEERCDGVEEEECLMRRTLAAHVDYIYTQNHKN